MTQWFENVDTFAQKYHNVLIWIGAIFYRVAFDLMYIWALSPVYAYEGMVYSPNFLKYAISWIIYLLVFFYMPKEEKSTPVALFHIQWAYIFTPIIAYYGLANQSSRYMLMVFLCMLLQTYIIKRPVKKIKPVCITGVRNYVSVSILIILVPVLLIPILYNGFAGINAFDISSYYQTIRNNSTYPIGYSYLFGFMAHAIIPFFMAYFLTKKKYVLFVLAVMLQVLLYMESGYRGILFYVVPIVLVFICTKSGHLIKLMYLGLTILLLVVVLAYKMDSVGGYPIGAYLNSFIGERGVGGGGVNKFLHYNCFSQYPKILFSDGLLGKLFGLTYLYNGAAGQIAYAFSGGEYLVSNSVTGYIGESYAQIGLLGMILTSTIWAFILRSLYHYDGKENIKVIVPIFTIFVIMLNDNPLFTIMLSCGMFVSYLLIMVYLRPNSKGVL